MATRTIEIVTHNMAQAMRSSHRTGFMLMGELVKIGETAEVFGSPGDERAACAISAGTTTPP